MTFLRYFIPLIIEGNKRNISSLVLIGSNNKYTSPHKYKDVIRTFSNQFKFKTEELNRQNLDGITFLLEGVDIDEIKGNSKKIILTYQRDFSIIYNNYIKKTHYVVMPSKFFAEHYNTISEKNLYLGSPKYDVVLEKLEIIKKYGLKEGRMALVVFPKIEFMNKEKYAYLEKLYNCLKLMGYIIIVKTRGKDPVPQKYRGDKYFEDFSWFPHTTMELIEVADVVINFDSTTIKECVMMNRPVINFNMKPERYFSFLYDDNYSRQFSFGTDVQVFKDAVEKLSGTDLNKGFYEAREKYLFQPGNVSKKILDVVM